MDHCLGMGEYMIFSVQRRAKVVVGWLLGVKFSNTGFKVLVRCVRRGGGCYLEI